MLGIIKEQQESECGRSMANRQKWGAAVVGAEQGLRGQGKEFTFLF